MPLLRLGQNPTIYSVSPDHVQASTRFPDHIRLNFVCVTLSHRINRTGDGSQCKALTESYYQYRGLAIRSLREDIDVEHTRSSDFVLAGIVTLLLCDVSSFSSSSDEPAISNTRRRQTQLTLLTHRFNMAIHSTGATTRTGCTG